MLGAKKRESFCCLLAAPLVTGVLRRAAFCTTVLDSERDGVLREPDGRLVRSLNAGLEAEFDLIQPVGLTELAEDEVGVELVAACPAAVCLDTMLCGSKRHACAPIPKGACCTRDEGMVMVRGESVKKHD